MNEWYISLFCWEHRFSVCINSDDFQWTKFNPNCVRVSVCVCTLWQINFDLWKSCLRVIVISVISPNNPELYFRNKSDKNLPFICILSFCPLMMLFDDSWFTSLPTCVANRIENGTHIRTIRWDTHKSMKNRFNPFHSIPIQSVCGFSMKTHCTQKNAKLLFLFDFFFAIFLSGKFPQKWKFVPFGSVLWTVSLSHLLFSFQIKPTGKNSCIKHFKSKPKCDN